MLDFKNQNKIKMKKVKIFLMAIAFIGFWSCKKIDLKPEFEVKQISFQQAELIRAFSGLTDNDESACNVISDPTEIPDVLCRIIIEAEPGSEIVFLVDHTTSMTDDINEVKRNINKIIDCLPDGVRLGAATYGDVADGPVWYTHTPLTEDFQSIRDYVNGIRLVGGGFDLPESVYDGIWTTLDIMPWRDCQSPDKIIVMGDAPPLTGGRSTYTLEDVLAKAESICPDTEFYPVIVLDL